MRAEIGLRRRNAASALPRTTSHRRWRRRASSSRAPRSVAARRRSNRAGSSGLPRVAGEDARTAMTERGDRYVASARMIDRADRDRPSPGRTAGAEAAAGRAPARAVGHRDRDADPRSLRDLCQARPESRAARPVRRAGRRRASAARSIHEALARFTKDWSGPFDAAAEAAARRDRQRRACRPRRGRRRARGMVDSRFAAIARWLVAWERRATRASPSAMPKSTACWRYRCRRATFHVERPRRPHRSHARRRPGDLRFQDRHAADRADRLRRADATNDAGGGNGARRRVRRHRRWPHGRGPRLVGGRQDRPRRPVRLGRQAGPERRRPRQTARTRCWRAFSPRSTIPGIRTAPAPAR